MPSASIAILDVELISNRNNDAEITQKDQIGGLAKHGEGALCILIGAPKFVKIL